jgi:membrane-associated phospholipid phosphatase
MNLRIKDVLNRVNVFFILYLIFLLACLLIKIAFTREEIYFAVNGLYSYPADEFFKYYTHIGDGFFTMALTVILLLFFSYRQGFLLITSYALSSGAAQLLKYSYNKPRPMAYFADQLQNIHFVEGVYVYTKRSFPSGHSVTAFSMALLISYFCAKKSWSSVLFMLALLAGYSRMYLSEHFFEDVIAGSLAGVIVTVLWLSWIDSKPFLHTAKWNRALFRK